jgi:predicted nucleic acid-binding protein
VHLDLAAKLSLYFDVVYVPRAVQREVNRKGKFRYRLRKLYETGVFTRCTAADKWNVQLHRADLDEGEAEALVQAQEKAALFFIGDEKRARDFGENKGLKCVGTARVLARLNLEGHAPDPNTLLRKLRREVHFWASDEVLEQAIAMASEPI